ncbi:uncharacterized protein LY79DRAFT_584457 [Colletotrichum navitas]|uniref:Uncharacterized protein n=1 Tax=Colletotrichum navitas TaxID=681940 RepID=A0AAD8PM69_9PEZI|nr:uncharacterized protein LY79DRAFT_584457 [Colletotrichum navitas]KAK1569802.1 hypothetical protein LY79DRAFT_584457 [Colletotrichum navitas]
MVRAAVSPVDQAQAGDRRKRTFKEAGATFVLRSDQYRLSLRLPGRTVASICIGFFNKQAWEKKKADVVLPADLNSVAYVSSVILSKGIVRRGWALSLFSVKMMVYLGLIHRITAYAAYAAYATIVTASNLSADY